MTAGGSRDVHRWRVGGDIGRLADSQRFSDSGGNLAGATVSVGTGFQSGDTLNFTNQNGITGSYNTATRRPDIERHSECRELSNGVGFDHVQRESSQRRPDQQRSGYQPDDQLDGQ